MHESANAHFADLVAPLNFVGEAVYTAVEAAAGLVGRAFRAAKAKARERSAVNSLSGLDDETLKDIGIGRSEIRYVARKLAADSGVDYRSMCQ
jgi:uncharacterized protein YjiS (DUF1127 family)